MAKGQDTRVDQPGGCVGHYPTTWRDAERILAGWQIPDVYNSPTDTARTVDEMVDAITESAACYELGPVPAHSDFLRRVAYRLLKHADDWDEAYEFA